MVTVYKLLLSGAMVHVSVQRVMVGIVLELMR